MGEMGAAPALEFAFEARVSIAAGIAAGPTSVGERRMVPITGGTFEGPRLKGEVLAGGADWQLTRPDGAMTIEAIYAIRTDDGAVIAVRNCGVVDRASGYVRTTPTFEAPIGPHDWLNKAVFVGTLRVAARDQVVIRVYRVC